MENSTAQNFMKECGEKVSSLNKWNRSLKSLAARPGSKESEFTFQIPHSAGPMTLN